jgi:hypothetical protein
MANIILAMDLEIMSWHAVMRHMSVGAIMKVIRSCGKAHTAFHQFPLELLLAKTSCPYEILGLLVCYWWHLPPQGGALWLLDKKAITPDAVPPIGGSEVDSILGSNQYKRLDELIASKVGLKDFDGNDDTRWGNMCEEITSGYAEMIMHCKTYETGSIPGLKYNGKVIQKYSPDRLGVVEPMWLSQWLPNTQYWSPKGTRRRKDDVVPTTDHYLERPQIVLFEFKNPARRIPNGEIPKGYCGQIQLGLHTITCADLAMFVDMQIRKCAVKDFGCSSMVYDTNFHMDRAPPSGLPIACGVIGFYRVGAGRKAPPTPRPHDCRTPAQLAQRILSDIKTPGSDYSWIAPHIQNDCIPPKHVIAVVALANRWMPVCESEYGMMVETLAILMPEMPENYREMIPTALDTFFYMNQTQDVGPDLGADDPSAGSEHVGFSELLKEASDSRGRDDGVKWYYSPGFYLPEYEYAHYPTEKNYVDLSLEEPQRAAKWLKGALNDFGTWCDLHGHRPLGYMPWKMFSVSVVPMARNPDFMETARPAIIDAWERTKQILEGTHHEDLAIQLANRQARYDAMFAAANEARDAARVSRQETRNIRNGIDPVGPQWDQVICGTD